MIHQSDHCSVYLIAGLIVKFEVDHLQDEYLEVVYKVIKALETPLIDLDSDLFALSETEQLEWEAFVDQYAGCLKEAPVEFAAGSLDWRKTYQAARA